MDGAAKAMNDAGSRARQDDICILMNGGAGRNEGNDPSAEIRGYAAARPGRVELRVLPGGSDLGAACRAALDEGFGTIVAAGGDGTVTTVAGCLAGTGVRMGILPLGTFNFFARTHGIPETLSGALRLLDTVGDVPLDAARVNGHLFLNNASVGIYPRILADREAVYRRWGRSRLAAYWSVVRTVAGFRRARRMKVVVDGRAMRVKTPLVFVAFNPFQIEAFGLPGADAVRAGEFAVFVAPDCGRVALMFFAARLLLRGMRRGTDFELLHGREVEIDTLDPLHRDRRVAVDGEKIWLEPPLHFAIEPEAIRLVAPPPSVWTAPA